MRRKRVSHPSFRPDLTDLLLATRFQFLSQFRVLLNKLNLTEQQWRVLRTVEHFGPIHLNDLATATRLTVPSLSRMLRGLERRGMLDRSIVHDGEGRFTERLSANGRTVMDFAGPRCEAVYGTIVAHFGHDRIVLLQSLLREFLEGAERVWGQPVAQPAARRSRSPRAKRPWTGGQTSSSSAQKSPHKSNPNQSIAEEAGT